MISLHHFNILFVVGCGRSVGHSKAASRCDHPKWVYGRRLADSWQLSQARLVTSLCAGAESGGCLCGMGKTAWSLLAGWLDQCMLCDHARCRSSGTRFPQREPARHTEATVTVGRSLPHTAQQIQGLCLLHSEILEPIRSTQGLFLQQLFRLLVPKRDQWEGS